MKTEMKMLFIFALCLLGRAANAQVISGTVMYEGRSGLIPAPGLRIDLKADTGGEMLTYTSRDGKYNFRDVEAGLYVLHVYVSPYIENKQHVQTIEMDTMAVVTGDRIQIRIRETILEKRIVVPLSGRLAIDPIIIGR